MKITEQHYQIWESGCKHAKRRVWQQMCTGNNRSDVDTSDLESVLPVDPISMQVLSDAWFVVESQYSYNGDTLRAISAATTTSPLLDPMTRYPILQTPLINRSIRDAVHLYEQKHGEIEDKCQPQTTLVLHLHQPTPRRTGIVPPHTTPQRLQHNRDDEEENTDNIAAVHFDTNEYLDALDEFGLL